MRRIALACPNFPPEFTGGTERVVAALAHALRSLGLEVVVISGTERPHCGEDVVAEDFEGLPVLRVPLLPEEGYGLELVRPRVVEVVRRLLVTHEVDVLHVHHWAGLTVALVRLAREAGVPSVVTLHDMWTSCGRFFRHPPRGIRCPEGADREPCGPCAARDLKAPVWGLRLGIADRDREIRGELRTARFVTAPSRFCAEATMRHVPWPGPIEVLPHGLLEPVGDPGREPRPPAGRLRVGTYGNLVAAKGVEDLVEAVARVEGCELHLFGPFLDRAYEEHVRFRAHELGVDLICHGPYDARGPHPARLLDVAVFPSRCEESYGLGVDEALARGVPVVVSDRGALRERAGEAGVVARAGDVGALSEVLGALRADPERLRGLRAHIPARFPTIRDAAQRYTALYRRAHSVRSTPAGGR